MNQHSPKHEHIRLSHPEIRAIVLGIMLAMFLGALDQTIVATALPTIGRTFGDLGDLAWVVTAYLLTGTAVTPLYGKLSDIHGRRALMLIAIVLFMAGSLACALAPNMQALILGRALQGCGGGGLLALAQTIIADIVSRASAAATRVTSARCLRPPRSAGRCSADFSPSISTGR